MPLKRRVPLRRKASLPPSKMLTRSTKQLTRTPLTASRKPIPFQSAKRKAAAPERRAFVAEFLAEHPMCQITFPDVWRCPNPSVDVHESLRRSAGGAIVPGEKATAQGQTFWAVCRECHEMLTNPDKWEKVIALERGWIQSRYNR